MLGSALLVAGVLAVPAPAAAHDVDPADFQQVTLARGVAEVGEPMAIAVLPDRSVLHTARDGTVLEAVGPRGASSSPSTGAGRGIATRGPRLDERLEHAGRDQPRPARLVGRQHAQPDVAIDRHVVDAEQIGGLLQRVPTAGCLGPASLGLAGVDHRSGP